MSKYPSKSLYSEWQAEWLASSPDDQGEFLIRKACDWQREQDALICLKTSEPACDCVTCETRRDCADALRNQ